MRRNTCRCLFPLIFTLIFSFGVIGCGESKISEKETDSSSEIGDSSSSQRDTESGAVYSGATDSGGDTQTEDTDTGDVTLDTSTDSGTDTGIPDTATNTGADTGAPDTATDTGADTGVPDTDSGTDTGTDSGVADTSADSDSDTNSSDTDGICVEKKINLEFDRPQLTVMILMDRSGSMGEEAEGFATRWEEVQYYLMDPKDGVVAQLDSVVRFGITFVAGNMNDTSGECLQMESMAPALDNYDPMASAFSMTVPSGSSPMVEALETATASLVEDTTAGRKILVLITDGALTTCDPQTPADIEAATQVGVGTLSGAHEQGIDTYVVNAGLSPPEPELQQLANAGAGITANDTTAKVLSLSSFFEDILTNQGICHSQALDATAASSLESCVIRQRDFGETQQELFFGDSSGNISYGWEINSDNQIELPAAECEQIYLTGEYSFHCPICETDTDSDTDSNPPFINHCGDGLVIGEACDDGNLNDGDGCSSSCEVENGFQCVQPTCEADNSCTAAFDLKVNYRDFSYTHSDFAEDCVRSKETTGMVADTLGADGKPQFIGEAADVCVYNFADWYNGAPHKRGTLSLFPDNEGGYANRYGVNGEPWLGYAPNPDSPTGAPMSPIWEAYTVAECEAEGCVPCLWDIVAAEPIPSGCTPPNWEYNGDPLFFPLDDLIDTSKPCTPEDAIALMNSETCCARITTSYGISGWMWEAEYLDSAHVHNFYFTSEAGFGFIYTPQTPATITCLGDDDIWVFVNGQLAIDLGGVHPPATGTVTIDSQNNFGMQPGNAYKVSIFQAERQVEGSSFMLEIEGFSLLSSSSSTCTPLN